MLAGNGRTRTAIAIAALQQFIEREYSSALSNGQQRQVQIAYRYVGINSTAVIPCIFESI